MAYKDLLPNQKIIACHVSLMKHPVFCILGGVTQIGSVVVDDSAATACTDGENVWYNPEFIKDMSRKQLTYLICHENFHKALYHCTEYLGLAARYPNEFGQAIDYVVNWQLESMDLEPEKFLERPTNIPPLIDAAYANMSVPEVVRELLKKPKQGGGGSKPMDKHVMRVVVVDGDVPEGAEEVDAQAMDAKALAALKEKIADAVRHGEIMQSQMRGTGGPTVGLSGFREARTDWRPALRRFFQEMCEGDEQSRFNPPNKRMLPLDILLPSHFSETTGEIIIACDTSGSMAAYYGLVFGEIASICMQLRPSKVRVIWWHHEVAGEQVFEPKDYDKLRTCMHPRGGGGTTVSCVAAYIRAKQYKPKATVMLTDGYIESSYEPPAGNLLWGVVNNPRFVPVRGKVIHIEED